MPLPKEVLAKVDANIKLAKSSLAELKDVVSDMRLSGMDTAERDKEVKRLADELRSLEIFYERQKAKPS
ncbi:unnamed protein product [marine sediment metagenome]|uniref:Uncharacterized protein n=1 Tax=marine sediment metagenome TaxID=412755 RepID=X1TUG2_9ZZZZ